MSDVTVGERTEDKPAVEVDHPWWALVAVLIGMSMIIIDGSIVNVLLPNMVQDIGLTQVDTQWVNSIYSLIFAALLITVGLMADKHGRRLLFILGAIVFIIGSISSGASQGPGWLIGSRAVQAVGASMMLPSTVAVVNVMFSGRQRAMAFGFWGAVFGGAAALGPLLGGWLAQDFSWRWAFYVNIPVAIVSVIMVLKLVPETKGVVTGKLDIVGVVLSAVGLGLLVWGVIEGQQYGWWTAVSDWDVWFLHLDDGGLSVVPISLVIGAILVGLFVLWEFHRRRAGKGMLIDIALFKIRRYAFGNVVALIVALGDNVLRQACHQAAAWRAAGHAVDFVSVNVSGRQLDDEGFFERVAAHLTAADLPPQALELEVTESVLMGRPDQALGTLNALRALGVRLAIDDFGTGYSSLAHLKRLPVNKLKLDRSFVAELPQDAHDAAIARAVMALGRSLDFTVVAEGVETAEQLAFLRSLGCDLIQGFHYGQPLAAERISFSAASD